jgi:SHS2 domain-containing protein
VWAPTREELFAEAARALIALMGEGRGPRAHEVVALEAPDADALFVDWLSEILFLFEARRFVPDEIELVLDGMRLRASMNGKVAESFAQTGPAVKAVTYHGLQLTETDARVYLDV